MPSSLVMASTNVFGERLACNEDSVLTALHSFITGEVDIQLEALSGILSATLLVLQRQMKIFLEEPQPSTQVMQKSSSAPTHNMASERGLGCLDKMMRRAPVATGGFLTGKVKSKLNKCTAWLENKPDNIQEKLIHFAIVQAKQDRVRRCVLDREVYKEISVRRKEVSAERQKKSKASLMRNLKKALITGSSAELKCGEPIRNMFQQYLTDSQSLIGTLFLHTVDGSEYYGRINIIEKEEEKMWVGYWGLEDSEAGAVDYFMTSLSIFADSILGQVVFL
ncbi:hypothetical protein ElyMa_003916300 [Elysia marginata]|uniref:Uncharacterized protein n=1 Tax=Elysia marginata TaxID=1093978 RepID=A0AAV4FRC4_9GAST|nr:hypothetical protein ElyMa_003916300 [Elysia marginata]